MVIPCRTARPLRESGREASEGHGDALDKQRDYPNVSVQRGLDFNSDDVLRVINASSNRFFGLACPPVADDDEDYVALLDDCVDMLSEVHAQGDGIDVFENGGLAELLNQAIINAASHAGIVLPAIGNEDLIVSATGIAHRSNALSTTG